MLGTSDLIEGEINPDIMKGFANQISSRWRDMVITLSEYHHKLALDIARSIQTIVFLPCTETMAVEVCGEVADCSSHTAIKSAAIGEMPTQTHSSGADSAIAGLEREEKVDGEGSVFVVGGELLSDFPLIAGVCAGNVVGEGLGACEFMVGRWGGDYVTLTADLPSKAGNGASHCGREKVGKGVFTSQGPWTGDGVGGRDRYPVHVP